MTLRSSHDRQLLAQVSLSDIASPDSTQSRMSCNFHAWDVPFRPPASTCLSVHLSVIKFVCHQLCLSSCLPTCLTICLSANPFAWLQVCHQPVCLSVSLSGQSNQCCCLYPVCCDQLPVLSQLSLVCLQLAAEASIPEACKFYCPHPTCSALMVAEQTGPNTSAECPACHRLLCLWCRTPWHARQTCGEAKVTPGS